MVNELLYLYFPEIPAAIVLMCGAFWLLWALWRIWR
jgi:hypothetical protein